MLLHYLQLAVRNIKRNKLYSLINIGGLALGIAVCMTIMLYVLHEHRYDRFHENAGRIFSTSVTIKMNNNSVNLMLESMGAASLAKERDPNVVSFARFHTPFGLVALQDPSDPGKKFTIDKNFIFADSNFFSFFTFPLLRGNSSLVLQNPGTLVISERAAKQYFGNSDPVGKTLRFNDQLTLQVTGVAADPPSNSSIDFDFVASLSTMSGIPAYASLLNADKAGPGAFRTFLLLNSPSAAGKVEKTLQALTTGDGKDKEGYIYHLTSLPEIHLGNNFGDTSNLRYLRIFPLVAGLILLLAIINYVSLATARATLRAKEVGVRKVIGAGRQKLALQFYTESAVYAVLSFLAGTLLFLYMRPWFFGLLQLRIDDSFLYDGIVISCFAGLLLLVIVCAGSYPSLVLSSFNPVMVLYGRLSRQRGGVGIRKGFMVFQFTLSVALIACSLIIGRQLDYIRHQETGVNRDNVLMIPFKTTLSHYASFKQEVERLPSVSVTATANSAFYKGYNAYFIQARNKPDNITLPVYRVDEQFIPLLGLQWKINPLRESDWRDGKHIVINETAVSSLNLPANPISEQLDLDTKSTIAGVLQDFNYASLQSKIGPLCLIIASNTDTDWGTKRPGCLYVRIKSQTNIPSTLETIRAIYDKYDKTTAFSFQFMDEAFDNMYKAEDRLASLMNYFTLISVLIACIGLFALSAFSAQQRTREIGIRKVLGASTTGISVMLTSDFVRLTLLAILIALPLSWWVMHQWLKDFAYRIHISWTLLLLASCIALAITLLTTGFHALKAANANPAGSLRAE